MGEKEEGVNKRLNGGMKKKKGVVGKMGGEEADGEIERTEVVEKEDDGREEGGGKGGSEGKSTNNYTKPPSSANTHFTLLTNDGFLVIKMISFPFFGVGVVGDGGGRDGDVEWCSHITQTTHVEFF